MTACFVVDVATGNKRLLVSFQQLAAALRGIEPAIDQQALFINHTLWSRDDSRIYFYVRGGWDRGGTRVNVPVVMNADGSNLRPLKDFIGGHPEWLDGQRLIGTLNSEQVIYDCEAMKVVGTLGDKKLFPKPGDDIALSPDGAMVRQRLSHRHRKFLCLPAPEGWRVGHQPGLRRPRLDRRRLARRSFAQLEPRRATRFSSPL